MSYAICTLVESEDAVTCAIILAKSIKLTNQGVSTICMITNNMSEYMNDLHKHYNSVRIVDNIDMGLTMWRMLSLTEYTKVLYLRPTSLIVTNITHLFQLSTPAAFFGVNSEPEWTIGGKNIPHGTPISYQAVARSKNDCMYMGAILISPTVQLYENLKSAISSNNLMHLMSQLYTGTYIMNWTQLGIEYVNSASDSTIQTAIYKYSSPASIDTYCANFRNMWRLVS